MAWAATAQAWNRHDLVTAAALQAVPELRSAQVTYNAFRNLLVKLGLPSEEAFNQKLQIHKAYRFEAKAGESVGRAIPVADVLSKYSDEPDWGMDQGLFEADQYPELWDDAYSMMGGKEKGTPSQAFRHMYWPEFSWTSPLATFKLPFGKLGQPMGQAPERARIFVEWSLKAKAAGEDYWAARFLANAIHYLQDVGQPFHSTQTPTKKYLLMPFTKEQGRGFKHFVLQITRVVSYYHFAFEDYLSSLMDSPEGRGLWDALARAAEPHPALEFSAARENDVVRQVQEMALFSNQFASDVASACLEFFPEMTEPFASIHPKEFLHSPAIWSEIEKRGSQDSAAKTVYFDVVQRTFGAVGVATRALVKGSLTTNGGR